MQLAHLPARRLLPALAATALISVFAVVALSVVGARSPFAKGVDSSFDSAVSKASSRKGDATSLGCTKRSANLYACSAVVRAAGRPESATVHYRLTLWDDGCWDATVVPKATAPPLAGLRAVRGCLAH
jgi:hypothetical protein